MSSHSVASCNLVSSLFENGFTLNPDFFVPTCDPWFSKTPLKEFPGVLVESTEFYSRIWDYFDSDTLKWAERLKDPNPSLDWHYLVFPQKILIDVESDLMVAATLSSALGYVIEGMENSRLKPVSLERTTCGEITITSTDGPVVKIGKIKFEKVPELTIERATKALQGLEKSNHYGPIAKSLSKLHGYPKAELNAPEEAPDQRREMVLQSGKNLCIALDRALKPIVDKKIPQHLLQEFGAKLIGFESWNHLTGAVKKHEDNIFSPHHIAFYQDDCIRPEKGVYFYPHIAAGLAAFGNFLSSRPDNNVRTEWTLNGGISLVNSIQTSTVPESMEFNCAYVADCESEILELASVMQLSENAQKILLDYFFVELDTRERLVEFNKRVGITEDDYLFIGDWVYWVKREESVESGYFRAEKLSDFGKYVYPRIGASRHKAALTKDNNGEFWLITDWDNKPKFKLPDLTEANAKLIEQKFFHRERWREARYDIGYDNYRDLQIIDFKH